MVCPSISDQASTSDLDSEELIHSSNKRGMMMDVDLEGQNMEHFGGSLIVRLDVVDSGCIEGRRKVAVQKALVEEVQLVGMWGDEQGHQLEANSVVEDTLVVEVLNSDVWGVDKGRSQVEGVSQNNVETLGL
jgi:hypothetical protein